MAQNNIDYDDEVARLAESFDLPYQVRISEGLAEQLKPNEFMAGLGIQYLERVKTVLGILKAKMVKERGEETLPEKAQVIPLSIASGPYIREGLVSIKAEVTDDEGGKIISLTSILEGD